jgi:hypothetical protein
MLIKKSKHPKRGNTRNKKEEPMSKKTANHLRGQTTKMNIKFLNPLLLREKGRSSSKDS